MSLCRHRCSFEIKRRSFERLAFAARVAFAVLAASTIASSGSAGVYYVDPARPGASDFGPGTIDIPCRTIQGAVTAFGSAGNIIIVRPGTYRETVTLAASGTLNAPIVLKASEPGVIVTGTDDYSVPAQWAPIADGVHLAAAVTWQPFQVFIDGVRLAPAPALPAPLPPQTFRWIPGEGLYVNVGDNPGSHACEVGRRATGIFLSGVYGIVEGFEINRHDDRAVLVGGAHAIIRECTIRFANKYGIDVTSAPDVQLLSNTVSDNGDHGIIVKKESTRCRIAYNESFRNARPGARAANGLDVDGSIDCVVENNRFHHNQDSGMQFVNGANNGLSRNNASWANGDHGFDHVRTTGIRHFHDVAHANARDGFSFEGFSGGGSLNNCIATDNGLATREFNLWVDEASSEGFVSDYNIFWNSTPQKPIKFRGFQFLNLAEYSSSSGLDRHSRAQDARFMNAAAGDFRLRAGSPAIDAATADSASYPLLDAADQSRFDDPATANAGSGSPDYADLGASEYRNAAPVVAVRSNLTHGIAPQAVEFDAASSSDADGGVVSYTFDFGDGSPVVAAQLSPLITHVYGAGVHTATVIVTDAFGAKDTAQTAITIAQNLCANPGMESDLSGWEAYGPASVARVVGGHSGSSSVAVFAGAAQAVGLADHPNVVSNVPAAGIRYQYSAWVRSASSTGTVKIQLREYLSGMLQGPGAISAAVRLSPVWQPVAAELTTVRPGSSIEFEIKGAVGLAGEDFEIDDVQVADVTDAAADHAPIITAPVTANATPGERLTMSVSAADPDGDPLTALVADLSLLPAGSNASFVVNLARTGGTLTWTPVASDARASGYRVMFTASNAMGGSAGTTIFVGAGTESNLCGNAGFESGVSGWGAYGPATIARVEGGHSGAFCAEVRATGSTTIGLGDLPNWVTVPAAGIVYRYSAWVRSAASTGSAKLVIREFLSGTQQGVTVYSTAVRLSPEWQMISADIRTLKAGSTLEFEIKDYQATSPEVFQIDDVAIVRVASESGGDGRVSRANLSPVLDRFSAAITPNPIRSEGTLDLVLTRRGSVDVQIYDLEGRSVASPCASSVMDAGHHRIAVSLADPRTRVAPGAYFYRVVADEGVLTGKVLVVR